MKKWLAASGLIATFVTFIIGISLISAIVTTKQSNQTTVDGGIEISEIGEKEIPKLYIPVYKAAGEKYDIAWTLIAAFHKVETNFGTTETMVSYAGAIGHFQFLPETWLGWGYGANPPQSVYENPSMIKRYGGYGVDANSDGKADPYDIMDAAFACANYVKASGGMDNLYQAIFSYNHADWYVEKIMSYYEMYSKGDYTSVDVGAGSSSSKGWLIPIANPIITSGFGPRWGTNHNGIDFGHPVGTPIKASKSGKVVIAQYDGVPVSGYGICTIIDHQDGTWTLYAHQSEQNVKVGESVKQGQVIGKVGNTGDSTGPHLHFEIRKSLLGDWVDPAPLLGL